MKKTRRRGAILILMIVMLPMASSFGADNTPTLSDVEQVIADVSPNKPFVDRLAEGDSENAPRKIRRKRVRKPDSGEVDLSALDASQASSSTENTSMSLHHGGPSLIDPHFSVYFDLLLAYQPGKAGFSFLNFHPELFMEVIPTPELIFSFEVNPTPRFYELDWQVAPTVQIRLGKIWIPFDDLNPHNIFGGMISTNRLRLGSVYFLPDIWSDLGVGTKINLVDKSNFTLDAHGYIVNGFGNSGAPDPTGTSSDYPIFSDGAIASADNNTDKAFGTRLHALIAKVLGLGISFYHGRWTTDQQDAKYINMLGLDSQIRVGGTEFRTGIISMAVGLPEDGSYNRVGAYAEFSQKFGAKDEWKVLLRAGYVDPDDRFTDENDVMTVGGGIRWKPGLILWAFEHYQDIKKVAGKKGYSFTMVRAVIQL